MKRTPILKPALKELLIGTILAFLSVYLSSAQTRTVRIVTYNIEDDTDGNTTPLPGLIAPWNNSSDVALGGSLEGIGEEIINGDPAQPIDILALEETTSNPTTVQPIVNGLNAFYAFFQIPAGYAMSPYQATEDGSPSDGNGPNALVYNTNTLQLIASVGIATPTGGVPSGNGMYRQCVRYEFAPAGVAPGTNNEFYVYVSHYKADSGSTDDADRLGEARIIRNDESANLPANSRALYVGDYNPDDNSGEPGYQTICSNNAPDGIMQGQGIDPLNTNAATDINWSDSTTNKQILLMLTEEGYELRYRDDIQIMTTNVYYDLAGGLQYVPGTYHSFANNATTPWGDSVDNGADTALNDLDPGLTNLTGLSASVLLEDLTDASDHLPVVADYTIPIPAPVITSVSLAGPSVLFNVANCMTGAVYTVLMAPNLASMPSNWIPVATNVCPGGNFTLTVPNAAASGSPAGFYLLRTQ